MPRSATVTSLRRNLPLPTHNPRPFGGRPSMSPGFPPLIRKSENAAFGLWRTSPEPVHRSDTWWSQVTRPPHPTRYIGNRCIERVFNNCETADAT